MSKINEAEKQEALVHLRDMIKPGDTLYTILRHVSASGMSRSISVVLMKDGQPYQLDYWISKTGESIDQRNGGVKRGGCGMNMGFDLVYSLSHRLFPEGYECIGERCPSNDHNNGDRDRTPHHHQSGGYALRQQWL